MCFVTARLALRPQGRCGTPPGGRGSGPTPGDSRMPGIACRAIPHRGPSPNGRPPGRVGADGLGETTGPASCGVFTTSTVFPATTWARRCSRATPPGPWPTCTTTSATHGREAVDPEAADALRDAVRQFRGEASYPGASATARRPWPRPTLPVTRRGRASSPTARPTRRPIGLPSATGLTVRPVVPPICSHRRSAAAAPCAWRKTDDRYPRSARVAARRRAALGNLAYGYNAYQDGGYWYYMSLGVAATLSRKLPGRGGGVGGKRRRVRRPGRGRRKAPL